MRRRCRLGPSGKKLADIADIVLDNHGVAGDALVQLENSELRVGPLSTIAGAFILNAVLTEAVWRINAEGCDASHLYQRQHARCERT